MSKDLINMNPFNNDSIFDDNNFFSNLGRNMFSGLRRFTNNDGYTNVANNAKNYTVSMELPGFQKKNIHLDYRNNTLSISAKHNVSQNTKNHKGNIVRQEFSTSNVARQFHLPSVIFDKISASYDGGILKIVLPKKHPSQPDSHTISIK